MSAETGDRGGKFDEPNDASAPLETFNLNHTDSTGLHPTAHDRETAHPGTRQPDQIVLEAHPSSDSDSHVSKWLQWWPIVVYPPAYALHRYYRRHRPRRLPPLTPLKLPGLYGLAFTSTLFFVQQAALYTEMVMDDKRLHIIDAAGDRAAATLDEPDGQEYFQSLTVEPSLGEVFKRIRDEDYHSAGIAGKLAWWDRHIWSDRETFDKWLLLIVNSLAEGQSLDALPREDLEICATHLANRSSLRASAFFVEQASRALSWSFGFSVPLAMLARWSGRRALFLPMNGLQRLLLGAWMYVDLPVTFRDLWYLQRVQEKDAAARVMVDLFGSFDEEFEEMGIDYGPDSPPEEDISDSG